METYLFDTVSLAKISLKIVKQDPEFVDDAIAFIGKHDSEDRYIQIASIIFSFYNSLYESAMNNDEKQKVISSMCDIFKKVFADKYMPIRCWELIFNIRILHGHIQDCLPDVIELIDLLDENKYPITTMYVYRKIANYIVNGELFFVEPYTSILDKIVGSIENVEFDLSKQPNYLS